MWSSDLNLCYVTLTLNLGLLVITERTNIFSDLFQRTIYLEIFWKKKEVMNWTISKPKIKISIFEPLFRDSQRVFLYKVTSLRNNFCVNNVYCIPMQNSWNTLWERLSRSLFWISFKGRGIISKFPEVSRLSKLLCVHAWRRAVGCEWDLFPH